MAEFNYSLNRRGVENMITVVMEPGCRDTSRWEGAVGLRLGSRLYVDLSADVDTSEFADGIQALRREIEARMRVQGVVTAQGSVGGMGSSRGHASQRKSPGQPADYTNGVECTRSQAVSCESHRLSVGV